MLLTKEQIRKLIELTKLEQVAEFDGYKVMKEGGLGYSEGKMGQIQVGLSIMLRAASR